LPSAPTIDPHKLVNLIGLARGSGSTVGGSPRGGNPYPEPCALPHRDDRLAGLPQDRIGELAEVIAAAFSDGLSCRGCLAAGKESPGLKGHEIISAFERFFGGQSRPYGDAPSRRCSAERSFIKPDERTGYARRLDAEVSRRSGRVVAESGSTAISRGAFQLSLKSVHGSTPSASAVRAILSIETLRSERSTELRYVRLMPHSWARAS
jgi:hypothetical protein